MKRPPWMVSRLFLCARLVPSLYASGMGNVNDVDAFLSPVTEATGPAHEKL